MTGTFTPIAVHDAIKFIRIMFEQIKIFFCQRYPA